jgi:hypothetical protein
MKKIFIALFVFPLLFNSCTITQYSGEIYPTTVQFDKANFKYIKTIKGSSEATYSYGVWDNKKTDGLVNVAKTNMYKQHPLQENQVPTNITVDILKEGEPTFNGSIELRKIKVIITADVYEFSNNGVYSSEIQSNNYNQPENDNQKAINQEKTLTENQIKVGDIVFKGEGKNKKECKVVAIYSKTLVEITYIRNDKERSQKIDVSWLYKKDANGDYYHP